MIICKHSRQVASARQVEAGRDGLFRHRYPSLVPVQPTSPLPTPVGFLRSAAEGMAELSWTGQGWLAAGEPLGDRLDADGVARLRPLRGLNVRWPSSRVPVEVITDLAAAGVPLHAADTPAWVDP